VAPPSDKKGTVAFLTATVRGVGDTNISGKEVCLIMGHKKALHMAVRNINKNILENPIFNVFSGFLLDSLVLEHYNDINSKKGTCHEDRRTHKDHDSKGPRR